MFLVGFKYCLEVAVSSTRHYAILNMEAFDGITTNELCVSISASESFKIRTILRILDCMIEAFSEELVMNALEKY
jgi:hypothetical protein